MVWGEGRCESSAGCFCCLNLQLQGLPGGWGFYTYFSAFFCHNVCIQKWRSRHSVNTRSTAAPLCMPGYINGAFSRCPYTSIFPVSTCMHQRRTWSLADEQPPVAAVQQQSRPAAAA